MWDGVKANPYHWPTEAWVVFLIAVAFLVMAVATILFIFFSRVFKSFSDQQAQLYRGLYRGILNSIIVQETLADAGTPVSALDFKLNELRSLSGGSTFRKQLLISQLLDLRKNLSGSAADILQKVYYSLHLDRESRSKLQSLAWEKRALGIRELAEMKCSEASDNIRQFLRSRNAMLRQEAFMALIRINDNDPLSFLDRYEHGITPWVGLNIHLYLQKIDARKLPDFSRWLMHPQKTVRIFILQMISQFRQLNSLPKVVKLLQDDDVEVVARAVAVIRDLEGYQYREDILAIEKLSWDNTPLSLAFVECLSRIGEPENDLDVLARFLDHSDYAVRLEAARALRSFGAAGHKLLEDRSSSESGEHIRKLMKHLAEPLLQ